MNNDINKLTLAELKAALALAEVNIHAVLPQARHLLAERITLLRQRIATMPKAKAVPPVTFIRLFAGEFDVLLNGEPTGYRIINGSRGLSGRDRNMYGIVKEGVAPRWIGSLQRCKKTLTLSLTHKGAAR